MEVNRRLIATYVSLLAVTLIALFLIKVLNISYPIAVTTSSSGSNELAVVGEGKVDAIPDTAILDAGIVVNNAATVEAAQSQINEINNEITSALTTIGVKRDDMKTSNYSINPNYVYDQGGPGRITGYNGNVTITIKVRDIEKLPQVIAATTEAGANQIINTQYTVDNPQAYREQARKEAIDNAKQQAEQLADDLGIRLGNVVNIVESSSGSSTPPIMYRAASESMSGGAIPDLSSGTQTVTSVVTLYFAKR